MLYIYNDTTGTLTYSDGEIISSHAYHEITDAIRPTLAIDNDLIDDITDDIAVISTANASSGHITNHSDALNLLKDIDLNPRDSDDAILVRGKITKTGWGLQCHSLKWETSKLSSISNKNYDGTDLNFATIKFYDSSDNELTTQSTIDSSCVKSEVSWEPDYDYEILGGEMRQLSVPTSEFLLWFLGLPRVTGSTHAFCNGGMDMQYVDLRDRVAIDGKAPKLLPYTEVSGSSIHTNELKVIMRHSAGYQHKMQLRLELFQA